jgi:CubicO group peptidase (beta-lactamase class C family)
MAEVDRHAASRRSPQRKSHASPAIRAALQHAVELGERSVQVAAYLDGELIVDAAIGDAADGVFPVFSVSKAVTALAVHVQAERGLIDYDAPLARYWPEYGTHGKEAVKVRHVLSHRAGVPQMPGGVTPESLADWDGITAALADLEPLFEPGTTNAYLSLSFGWLLGEVIRRTDPERRSFPEFVQEELCERLGVEAFWFGIPPEIEPRVARLTFPDEPPPPPIDSPVRAALPPAVGLVPAIFNRPDVHRAVNPSVGAIADARSIARLFSVLATGGEDLLAPARVQSFLQPRPDYEHDLTYGRKFPVGIGGFWLEAPGLTRDGGFGRVLGHPGAGGSIGWAELDTHLAVGICHDRMFGAADGEHPFAAVAQAIREVAGLPVGPSG